jgi:nitrate/nitrite transporter NarK
LLSLCFSAIQLSISAFTVTLLIENLTFGLVEAGLVMSAIQTSGVVGRIGWGWIGDRLGDRCTILYIIACTTVAGGCLVFTYSGVLLDLPVVTLLHGLFGRYTTVFAVLTVVAVVGL